MPEIMEKSPNWSNLKRFLRTYVRPRKGMFTFVQVLHVVAFAALLVPPLLIGYVIDEVIPNEDYTGLWLAAGGVIAMFALFFVTAAAKEYLGHEVAQRITSRLRDDLYGHFQKLSMSFHDREKPGALLSRIVDDINIIQEVVHHAPEAFLLAGVVVFIGGGLLLWLNWRLALVVLAVMPLMIVYVVKIGGKMWNRFREVRRRKADLSEELEENLNGIQIIKAFGTEDRETETVARQNADHYRSRMSVIRYMAMLFPGAIFLNGLAYGGVLLYGGYLGFAGLAAVGQLTAFFMIMGRFLHPVLRAMMMLEQTGRFFASVERFFEYMDIEPDIQDRPDAEPIADARGRVTFENTWFKYDDRDILRGIDFTVEPGQMVALVGPSGAGKTTVTRLIPRLYEPYRGRVLLDGQDVREVTLRSLREHIAMVLQDDFLFSGTVAENIAYGRPTATREEVVEAARLANVAPFVETLPDAYDTQIGRRGVRLSEGQRQRISIARALLKNPQILILDEATSSVDPETEQLIQDAMEHLRRGRTTFAIAHRLSTIFSADRILFIADGQILESGTHRELLDAGGAYAEFFRIQFRHSVPTS